MGNFKYKINQWIDRLHRKTQQSNMQHKHAAVLLDKRGKYLSIGVNTLKDNRQDRDYCSVHAEMAACRKVPRTMLKDSTLIVIRVSRNGNLLNSAPCDRCRELISNLGIKRIYYSVEMEF
jgi:tRNA(Arg) A34 adenosine deaminase TadA